MADIGSTLSQLGGDSNSLEAGQIIDLSNLNFNVTKVDNKIRQEAAQITVLEQRLKDGEKFLHRVEHKAEHLGKYLIKQQAKIAALMLVQSVTEDADLPIGARSIANIGVQTAYGAISTPGMPLLGAAAGFTFSTIHEIWHVIKEHEVEIERVKKVAIDADAQRQELQRQLNERIQEAEVRFRRELADAVRKQKDADAEVEYETAVGVER